MDGAIAWDPRAVGRLRAPAEDERRPVLLDFRHDGRGAFAIALTAACIGVVHIGTLVARLRMR